MRVVQISRSDNRGYRFNGLAIREHLLQQGIHSRHLVWEKNLQEPTVARLSPFPGSRALVRKLAKLEYDRSLQSSFFFQTYGIPLQRSFWSANVVHYHIINDGYFSILALPFLSWLKPTIWTWHDPWMMTGHCIYPQECTRWRLGCGLCPDLDRPFPMKLDGTAEMFDIKKSVMRRSSMDIIVASRWMEGMAKDSQIGKEARIHLIPFGVDLTKFSPGDVQAARRKLGVLDGHFVIFLRATMDSKIKGTDLVLKALEMLPPDQDVCIVSVQEKGLFNHFIGKYQVIELGWTDDEDEIIDAYRASDVFLMPSKAEAFGLMAVEAMACGKPIIVCEGTSLPDVTFAPDIGIAVPQNDPASLAAAISRLMDDPAECSNRGHRSREAAVLHYDVRLHAERMANLYRAVGGKSVETVTATEIDR